MKINSTSVLMLLACSLSSSMANAEGNCGDESFIHRCLCAENGLRFVPITRCLNVLDKRYLRAVAVLEQECRRKVDPNRGYCSVESTGRHGYRGKD